MSGVRAVAHRGDPWGHLENTLPAFASAINQGADAVEFDVRVTADGVPVVIHDATLGRIWGDPRRVADLSAAEVTAHRLAGVGIPTLAEALDLFVSTPVTIMIDLPDPGGVPEIVAVVAQHPARGQAVWSGEIAALRRVRELLPEAVLYCHHFDSALHPAMINFDGAALVPADIERAHAQGYGVSVWTIDDPATMRRLIAAGVDSITTNRLELLLRVRAESASLSVPRVVDAELAGFCDLAVQLGQLAIRAQRSASGFAVETKAHAADLVTEIDRSIERTVRAVIADELPGHVVVGEEYGGTPGPGYTWYCDPVDGTTNFANGLRWSSFSLALARDDELVVGVISDPWRDEVLSAVAGGGAWCDGLPVRCASAGLTGNVMLLEAAGTRLWPGMTELMGRLSDIGGTPRVMGSGTLNLAQAPLNRAAAGMVHRFHPIDHAASVLIAREAGADVLTDSAEPAPSAISELTGKPLLTAVPGLRDQLRTLLQP